MGDIAARPRKRRLGCLSSIALLIFGGLLVIILLELTIGPWIYVVGGRTRLLPVWAGVGEVAAPGKDMDAHEFHLYARYRPLFWSINQKPQPFLEFSGRWVGSDLVMTDEATVSHTFLPDGRLNVDGTSWHPKTGALPATFAETSWWHGWGRCR